MTFTRVVNGQTELRADLFNDLQEAIEDLQESVEDIQAVITVDGAIDHDGATVGFYGTTPVAKQTGVAVSTAGIHAALVNLGLIGA
jgi:ClpP class serine protease